jgi:hypothetical protein
MSEEWNEVKPSLTEQQRQADSPPGKSDSVKRDSSGGATGQRSGMEQRSPASNRTDVDSDEESSKSCGCDGQSAMKKGEPAKSGSETGRSDQRGRQQK